MKLKMFTFFIAVALIASGCSHDNKTRYTNIGPQTSSTMASSTTSTVAAPNIDPEADQTAAKKLLLTASDVPAGWDSRGSHDDNDSSTDIQNQLNGCLNEPPQSQLLENKVESDEFTNDLSTIDSEVDIYHTAASTAQNVEATLDSAHFPCLENVFNSIYADPTATATTQVSVLGGITTNTNQFAVRAITTVKGTGSQTSIRYIDDELGYSKDRFGVVINVNTTNIAPSTSLDRQLLSASLSHAVGTTA